MHENGNTCKLLQKTCENANIKLCFLFLLQSGETEPLDLGAPISSLDGLRVVLDRADPTSVKGEIITQALESDKTHIRMTFLSI